jgi:hypothetical protein
MTLPQPEDNTMGRYSFILVPRIGRTGVLCHRQGRIVLKGANEQPEVWADTPRRAHEILDDFVSALEETLDSRFAVKVLHPVDEEMPAWHPTQPDWAYSRIPLADIPLTNELSDGLWEAVLSTLLSYATTS